MPAVQGTITSVGYLSLRDFVQANWKYVSIVTDTGELMRLEIGVDSRANWTHTEDANPLEVTINLTGANAEIAEPRTFTGVYLYNVASGGSALCGGNHTQFTMESDDDTLQIKLQIELPTVHNG